MKKQKEVKFLIGSLILIVIAIIAVIGYKTSTRSVSVTQIGENGITETDVTVLDKDIKLSNKKENNNMDSVQTIKKDSGLIIEIQKEGTGEPVKSGDTVSVDYRGFLENGTIFDESYKRGQQFSFNVGAGQVIAGWEEGLLGMKVGEKRRLTIPSNLAYGPAGIPGVIPGGATLVFEIELHKIN